MSNNKKEKSRKKNVFGLVSKLGNLIKKGSTSVTNTDNMDTSTGENETPKKNFNMHISEDNQEVFALGDEEEEEEEDEDEQETKKGTKEKNSNNENNNNDEENLENNKDIKDDSNINNKKELEVKNIEEIQKKANNKENINKINNKKDTFDKVDKKEINIENINKDEVKKYDDIKDNKKEDKKEKENNINNIKNEENNDINIKKPLKEEENNINNKIQKEEKIKNKEQNQEKNEIIEKKENKDIFVNFKIEDINEECHIYLKKGSDFNSNGIYCIPISQIKNKKKNSFFSKMNVFKKTKNDIEIKYKLFFEDNFIYFAKDIIIDKKNETLRRINKIINIRNISKYGINKEKNDNYKINIEISNKKYINKKKEFIIEEKYYNEFNEILIKKLEIYGDRYIKNKE